MADPQTEQARRIFGKNLTAAYLERGFNQRAFAEAINVSPQTVGNWDAGRKQIRSEHMKQVVRVLSKTGPKVTADDLWPGWSELQHRPYGVGRRPSTNLRDMQRQIDALNATIDRMWQVIESGPADPAALRREAQELAGQDASGKKTRRRGRGNGR